MERTIGEAQPVLILGCNVSNCLAAVRTLGKMGIPLYLAGVGDGLVAQSRWYRPWPTVIEPTPETLARILKKGDVPAGVLVPCTDPWVRAVADLPADVAERYPASSPGPAAATVCLNKAHFAETLERLDLPRPRTLFPGKDKLPEGDEMTGYFLKPCDSFAFYAQFQTKGFQIENPASAERILESCRAKGLEVVVQEFIPGPAAAHHFLDGFMDRHGQIQALFARCRVREQHGALSNSSCLVSIDVRRMRTAAENLEKLLRAIGYRGLFSVEFKLDHRDGLFKFIEVNTRVWADMALALRCGVNVVDMLYRDALGREVRPVRGYKVGQHWVSMYRDRAVAMNLIASRQLSWSRFAWSWMGAAFDVFSLNDPKPAIWDFRQRLRWRRHQHVPAPSGVLESANRL